MVKRDMMQKNYVNCEEQYLTVVKRGCDAEKILRCRSKTFVKTSSKFEIPQRHQNLISRARKKSEVTLLTRISLMRVGMSSENNARMKEISSRKCW